jgi:hypothetical protein
MDLNKCKGSEMTFNGLEWNLHYLFAYHASDDIIRYLNIFTHDGNVTLILVFLYISQYNLHPTWPIFKYKYTEEYSAELLFLLKLYLKRWDC